MFAWGLLVKRRGFVLWQVGKIESELPFWSGTIHRLATTGL